MSIRIVTRRTGVTKAASIEPIRAAVVSTPTTAIAASAAKAPASSAPPCQRIGHACEREFTNQNEYLQRNFRGDARIHFVLHGCDSLTFKNSIRFASLGRRGLKRLSEICFGNFQSESTAMYSGD